MMLRYYSKWCLIGLLCLVTLWGCALQYSVTNVIDSRARSPLPNYKTYWLLPGDTTISASSLAYIDYAHYIERLLQQKGYTKAKQATQANVVIFLSYSITGPRTQLHTQTDPVFFANPRLNNSGCINCLALPLYQEHVYSEEVYQMQLQLTAYEAQSYFKSKQKEELWSVHDSVLSNSSDLRALFPYMALATAQYIGKDSGQQIKVDIPQNSPAIVQLKHHINATIQP